MQQIYVNVEYTLLLPNLPIAMAHTGVVKGRTRVWPSLLSPSHSLALWSAGPKIHLEEDNHTNRTVPFTAPSSLIRTSCSLVLTL